MYLILSAIDVYILLIIQIMPPKEFTDGPMNHAYFQGLVLQKLEHIEENQSQMKNDMRVIKSQMHEMRTWKAKLIGQASIISILFPAIILWLKSKIMGDK